MAVFTNLIGKRINGVFLAEAGWVLIFRDVEGNYYRYDTQNDCCNSVWVNHINGLNIIKSDNEFDLLRGVLVTGSEDKEWTDNRNWTPDDGGEYGDVIQDGFYTLKTDRGYIDIEVRNDHNGYYGGSFNEYDDDWVFEDLEDCKQVTEDF